MTESKKHMRLQLRPDGKCIQTVARKVRLGLEKALLSDVAPPDIDRISQELALLNDFLTTADFAALRASRPELTGTVNAEVLLVRDEDGGIAIEEAVRPD